MKPFLILQLRPLDAAADSEFQAFLKYGGLGADEVNRVRMERESIKDIKVLDYSGIIVGGGPSNISDPPEIKPDYQVRFERELSLLYSQIFEHDVPYLGSCYGLGSCVDYLGGRVSKERYAEAVGQVMIHLNEDAQSDPIFNGLPQQFAALAGHKEACQWVPEGGVLLGSSKDCPIQIVRFKQHIYATQFHTELDVTGIIERIHYYKHHGYFDPKKADALIERMEPLEITVPQKILKRFVDRFSVKRA
jgi:GMP synthase (glutamine-hydrolysing)